MWKKRTACLGAAMLLLLSGCGKEPAAVASQSGNTEQEGKGVYLESLDEIPEHLSGEIQESVTLDASIRKPQRLAYAEYRAEIDQRGAAAREKLEKAFFPEGGEEWTEDDIDGLMAMS